MVGQSIPETAKTNQIAIACSTGGFKGVFLHGVLAAFEEAGFRAAAYGAASSSVLPAAAAAVGRARALGLAYWQAGQAVLAQPGHGMSEMILAGIRAFAPELQALLFNPGSPRFLVAASAVDPDGAQQTQGKGARRLGRQLLLAAARGDHSWIDQHLTARLFDTAATEPFFRLTEANFAEVTYASSRMLHAWDIPAWVAGQPFIDAFYTCACPAVELVQLGYPVVLALANEPVLYRDIFQAELIPGREQGVPVDIIAPAFDPVTIGVNYTHADPGGLETLFQHGWQQGQEALARLQLLA